MQYTVICFDLVRTFHKKYSSFIIKNYLTSDKLMTNGKDPARQEPTNITRVSIHNIAPSSIILS